MCFSAMRLWAFVSVIVIAAISAGESHAAIIAQFDFGTSGTADNAVAYSEAPTVTASGVTVTNILDNGGATAIYDANAQTGRASAPVSSFRPNGGGGTAADLEINHDAGRYVYFDVTIDPQLVLNLTNLTLNYSRGTGGAGTDRYLGFATSLDGDLIFSNNTPVVRPNFDSANIDLTAPLYQNLSGTMRFKFAMVGTTLDVDSIVLNGELAPVPEPSTMVFAGLGAVGLLVGLRRRK
jgi:hypothetical protein